MSVTDESHLWTGAMHETRVGAEGDILWRNNGLELLCRHGPELHRDHGIHLAMTLQNGSALVSTPTCSLMDKKADPY